MAYDTGSEWTVPAAEGELHVPAEVPLVSCLCLTYARPTLLRESIWCFLQQDWPEKELVILNDHSEPVHLDREYPGVHLHNMPYRFGSLGEKRNFSTQLARGDYLFLWDDDDLFLPWRLSDSMKHLLGAPDRWAYKPMSAWMSTNNRDYAVVQNLFHNQIALRRVAFDRAGGYAAMNSGEDSNFEGRIPPERWIHYPARLHELVYVYRWGNNVTHISGMGTDRPGEPTAWERAEEYNRNMKGGVITPGFDRDYWQDLADAARVIAPAEAPRLEERLARYHRLGPDPE